MDEGQVMKIKPEHYAHMRDTIKQLTLKPEVMQAYRDVWRTDMRWRWDLWRAANLMQWTCDNLHP
jgi:hypothetical protein